ncbi:MAG: metallophosphoesterase family protein [bacterium]
MSIAVVGDIHSNLAALEAVLGKIDELGLKRVLFVGDLVGYNASPAECIALFRERNGVAISGNHDRYVTGQEMRDVRETTVQAVEYTRDAIGQDGIEFLRELPVQRTIDDRYLIVHGSILDPDEYMLSPDVIIKNLKELRGSYGGIDICFFGHSHYPAVIGNGKVDMKFGETRNVKLNPMKQYMLNPGSVGQPRDGVKHAAFGVFDPKAYAFTVHRVPYDVQNSHDRVLEAGLGRKLAERLLIGR